MPRPAAGRGSGCRRSRGPADVELGLHVIAPDESGNVRSGSADRVEIERSQDCALVRDAQLGVSMRAGMRRRPSTSSISAPARSSTDWSPLHPRLRRTRAIVDPRTCRRSSEALVRQHFGSERCSSSIRRARSFAARMQRCPFGLVPTTKSVKPARSSHHRRANASRLAAATIPERTSGSRSAACRRSRVDVGVLHEEFVGDVLAAPTSSAGRTLSGARSPRGPLRTARPPSRRDETRGRAEQTKARRGVRAPGRSVPCVANRGSSQDSFGERPSNERHAQMRTRNVRAGTRPASPEAPPALASNCRSRGLNPDAAFSRTRAMTSSVRWRARCASAWLASYTWQIRGAFCARSQAPFGKLQGGETRRRPSSTQDPARAFMSLRRVEQCQRTRLRAVANLSCALELVLRSLQLVATRSGSGKPLIIAIALSA